jgi:hypothetical protein
VKPISYTYENGMGWVRIFGYGIAWKDTSKHMLLYSERSGNTKRIQIGKWSIKYLKRVPDDFALFEIYTPAEKYREYKKMLDREGFTEEVASMAVKLGVMSKQDAIEVLLQIEAKRLGRTMK